MKKTREVVPIKAVIAGLVEKPEIGTVKNLFMLYSAWQEIVGDRIAENTAPQTVRNGILFVTVSNSVWMQELHYLRDPILQKLRDRLQSEAVKEIRFTLGTVPSGHTREDGEDRTELTGDEEQRVEKEASAISDPELRESFQDVMAAYLKRKKEETA